MNASASGIDADLHLVRPSFTLQIALRLPARGVSALFGPSGCGKTSCLRLLAGLEPDSASRISVRGETWQDLATRRFVPPHQRPVGYVFQQTRLFPHLNLQRNLTFGMNRVPPAQRRVALEAAVDLLGLGALMDRRADQLSGGELQRVGIARALVTSPRLLLMDEPLAALDVARKAEVMPYLQQLHRQLDLPVVYVSHAPDEVARLADHLVVMADGRAVASGPMADLLASRAAPALAGERAGALLQATVLGHDAHYHLLTLGLPGAQLRVPGAARPLGEGVRLFVLARDVSLSLNADSASSVLNRLPARVLTIADDAPGQRLLTLEVAGGARLLARITHHACDALGLAPGLAVFAGVKGVAVLA